MWKGTNTANCSFRTLFRSAASERSQIADMVSQRRWDVAETARDRRWYEKRLGVQWFITNTHRRIICSAVSTTKYILNLAALEMDLKLLSKFSRSREAATWKCKQRTVDKSTRSDEPISKFTCSLGEYEIDVDFYTKNLFLQSFEILTSSVK